ncbi:MAG: YceI family protein [SAR202 cluster bacterium]|nr:YceI family protein [SAR202 cluster bacterium]|tara:strand:+ start:3798 stop:4403 length:606 start_codon:yes stop_codon:yes gene_type:complete
MKKQITWQDNILKKIKFFLFFLLLFILPNLTHASERWVLDKSLSTVEFELPVLFAKNVKGTFNTIEGFIELDVNQKENNKAIFYVEVKDLDMNYIKYKDLLLSNIFFDARQFPKAVVDTKKFSYVNETELAFDVELTIKGKSELVPLIINVKRLAEELVQIQTELIFSRTAFEIGIGNWKNTSILKDKVKLSTNLFLFREE